MLGAPLGLLYANAAEWLIHKYVLHGVGKNKRSFWSFHFHEHHRASRKNDFRDADYERSVFGWHAQGKETLAVASLLVLHLPLFPIAPWFAGAVWYSGLNYMYKHKKAHLDPAWAKKHLKHHYDHHMGRDQDQNWCVTAPWFDYVMGTRVDYQYDAEGRLLKEVPTVLKDAPAASAEAATDARLPEALAPANDQVNSLGAHPSESKSGQRVA
jgi:Fatty acid hydroxylase superfamily